MDDRLANDLISGYEKKCAEIGVEILDLKYGARTTRLLVKVNGEEKEYTASVGGGTVLDSHVAVLRQAYWEEQDKLKPKKKAEAKKDNPMKGTLTYKDIYKQ